MTIDEAKQIIDELRGRFENPFNSSDKELIEQLYIEVTGRTFVATTCQQCYHDAVIEVIHYLNKNGRMAEKLNYKLRAGAIINCPTFKNGQVFTNDNLTDEIAQEYLTEYPEQEVLFEKTLAVESKKKGKK